MHKILLASAITVFLSVCVYNPSAYAQEHPQEPTQEIKKIPPVDMPEHPDSFPVRKLFKKIASKPHVQTNAEYKPYDIKANSMVDVDKALARARVRGTKVMVVMGANWCHDSQSFAARLDKPEFQTLIADNYELVYVSTGNDPGQKDQNRDISKRFGVDAIEGTPTVFIATPDGIVLNEDSAGFWRRAESIPVDMSYAYFDMYAKK